MINEKSNITRKLKIISSVFNIQEILDTKIDKNSVTNYYKINKLAYSLFHSKENLIHVGISKSGVFNKEDLLEIPKFVNEYVKNSGEFKLLELAAGRGANAKFILDHNPLTDYTGIDISPSQLGFAKKLAKNFQNLKILKNDYHNLHAFNESSFDLVFVIESLCYSNNKQRVLKEVYKVLKPGGYFIVIDGYLNDDLPKFTLDQQTAFKLTEIGMAIKNSDTYGNFIKLVKKEKYKIEFEENVSDYVIPSMKRLERYSRAYFKYLGFAKILNKLLPKEFIYNAITAFLWSDLMEEKVACYYITVLKKI